MAVNEINDVIPQNYKTKPIMPENLKRSDELDVGENNVMKGDSYYARNKRIARTNRIVILTLSITAILTGGGVLLANALLGKEPVINNFDNFFSVEGNVFSYTLDVTIDRSELIMNITNSEIVYTTDIKESGVYADDVILDSGNYIVNFISTNHFDYKRVLKQYTVTFTI